MQTTHYYIHVTSGTQVKNNLDKAIEAYLRSLDGKLVEATKLKETKETILNKITELNKEYSRCKPFNVCFWQPARSGRFALSGYYSMSLSLRNAKLVEHI